MKNQIIAIIFVLALTVATVTMGVATVVKLQQQSTPLTGSAQDNTFSTYTSATSVWVGKDLDTTLIATSSGRRYLQISNISGATTTPQALYCNVNGLPAVLYSGMVIEASSTRTFNLDGLYRGALHCKFPSASSTVAILEVAQ